eukprot:7234638-Pyramimonas_sp.AAC.1
MQVEGIIKYCGRTITKFDDVFRVAQAAAAAQVDYVNLTAQRGRGAEDRLAAGEVTSYRRALG